MYHVLNRTVAEVPLFRKEADYEAFERIMIEAHERHPTRILGWRLMRNHWHFFVWPRSGHKGPLAPRRLAQTASTLPMSSSPDPMALSKSVSSSA